VHSKSSTRDAVRSPSIARMPDEEKPPPAPGWSDEETDNALYFFAGLRCRRSAFAASRSQWSARKSQTVLRSASSVSSASRRHASAFMRNWAALSCTPIL
jgi:hypothetical protein